MRKLFGPRSPLCLLAVGALFAAPASLPAQGLDVSGRVSLVPAAKNARAAPVPVEAVVWLEPVDRAASAAAGLPRQPAGRFRLVQKDKKFTPHIIVVPAGAVVEFPNEDPFFHNVFSLFNGKRFDLGLYEAGTTRSVTFNTPGICYIFCNIHPEMSAVVVVTETPYFALSNGAGEVTLRGVPPGRYELNVWDEHCLPEALQALRREITVSASAPSFGELRLPESAGLLKRHKNLYGRDYDPGSGSSPIYGQP